MARLVAKDARSTTAANLAFLGKLTKLDVSEADKREVKAALPVVTVPDRESWRLGLLETLLSDRAQLEKEGKDTLRVVAMIGSLCTS